MDELPQDSEKPSFQSIWEEFNANARALYWSNQVLGKHAEEEDRANAQKVISIADSMDNPNQNAILQTFETLYTSQAEFIPAGKFSINSDFDLTIVSPLDGERVAINLTELQEKAPEAAGVLLVVFRELRRNQLGNAQTLRRALFVTLLTMFEVYAIKLCAWLAEKEPATKPPKSLAAAMDTLGMLDASKYAGLTKLHNMAEGYRRRRNEIVHNGGIVRQKYLDGLQAGDITHLPNVGDHFNITETWLEQAIDNLRLLAYLRHHQVQDKHSTGDEEQRMKSSFQFSYDLLEDGRYQLAYNLIDYLPRRFRNFKKAPYRTMFVNRLIAGKRMGKLSGQEASFLLLTEDAKQSSNRRMRYEELQTVRAALEEDAEAFFEWLPKYIPFIDPAMRLYAREWVVFEPFRSDPRYAQAFNTPPTRG